MCTRVCVSYMCVWSHAFCVYSLTCVIRDRIGGLQESRFAFWFVVHLSAGLSERVSRTAAPKCHCLHTHTLLIWHSDLVAITCACIRTLYAFVCACACLFGVCLHICVFSGNIEAMKEEKQQLCVLRNIKSDRWHMIHMSFFVLIWSCYGSVANYMNDDTSVTSGTSVCYAAPRDDLNWWHLLVLTLSSPLTD